MINIECTSCKQGLEVDERTLSDREVSVFRCPACGVSLMLDKRKTTRPVVTGPVVKVAADEYKPLPPRPAAEDLAKAAGLGEYVDVIASMYETAENYLKLSSNIAQREASLKAVIQSGVEAIAGMGLVVPPVSSDEEARSVVKKPADRAFDLKLQSLAKYLTTSKAINSLASNIWRNVLAVHRYPPIVNWQTGARAAVADAYGSVVARAVTLDDETNRLFRVQSDYSELTKRHALERTTLSNQITEKQKLIDKLESDAGTATKRVDDARSAAEANGHSNMQSGGCVGLVAAVIIGVIAGSVLKSFPGGFFVFIFALIGAIYLAYKLGYAKNENDRLQKESDLRKLRDQQYEAAREVTELRAQLSRHDAAAPEQAPPGETASWSLLTCDDFDPGAKPHAAVPLVDARLPISAEPKRAVAQQIPEVSPAVIAASQSAQHAQMTVAAASASARSVGFIPAAVDPSGAAVAAGAYAPESQFVLPAASPATERSDANPKRTKVLILSLVGAVLIGVIGYLVWASTFSLKARMNKAIAAGRFFAPAGSSVFDLYKAEQATNPRSALLAELKPKIQAALAPAGEDAFARWYKDSDDKVNWQELEHRYEFLAIMYPETPMYSMRRLYAVAQQSIDAHDYAKAISSYEDALKLDSSWVLALNGIGKVYMIDGAPMFNESLGVTYYERACHSDPNFTWAPKNLGDYYLRKSNYPMAEQYLRRALTTSPERPSILRALGYICRKTKRRSEAIAFYEKSTQFEKDPDKNGNAMKAISAMRSGE